MADNITMVVKIFDLIYLGLMSLSTHYIASYIMTGNF